MDATKPGQSSESSSYHPLQYGPTLGSTKFREAVASLLSEHYRDDVQPMHVVQTGGATNGLLLACTLLLPKGATVFVEDPTYFIAIKVLREDLRLNIVPVASDDDGIDVGELERLLERMTPGGGNGEFSCMVYLVSVYNNPKGICYSPDRCNALIRLARTHNALLITDDVYNMLNFGEDSAPPRLLWYDKKEDADYKGNVLSNGSFSKILGPGLRLGWIEAGDRIVTTLSESNILDSGGCPNHYTGEVVAHAINLGLVSQHLQMLRKSYAGGYFIWLKLKAGLEAPEVAKVAKDKYKLIVLPGERCSPSGSYRNCVRISFTFLEERSLKLSIEKLCQAIRYCMDVKEISQA